MANKGYVLTLLNALAGDVRKSIGNAFDYVLDTLTLGPIEDGKRATNAQIYWFEGTTHATPNTTFSIRHGLGSVPGYIILGAPLNVVNVQIVPLTVAQAADEERIYLASSSTNATFYVGVGL